jgi:MFS family permease
MTDIPANNGAAGDEKRGAGEDEKDFPNDATLEKENLKSLDVGATEREDSEAPISPSCSKPSIPTSPSSSEDASSEEDIEDLEALSPVQSGPAYSVFTKRQKQWIIFMVTVAAFISPTSANIFFPALNPLAEDLHVSHTIINLSLTSYMIFQGIAPTVVGDLADMAGRRPAYIICFIVYLGANVGLALQNSFAALFVLRCLQSAGSSGAIALSMGVVADVSTSAERGKYVGIVSAGTMVGPAIAPVIGGVLTQFLGWRSVFWFCFIFAGAWLVPYILTVPETGRNVVGNGSVSPMKWNMTIFEYVHFKSELKHADDLTRTETANSRRRAQADLASRRKLKWPNPLKTIHIVIEKDVALILTYNCLIYTTFYDIAASIPSLFSEIYGFNDLQIGLCYIPFGVGCATASILNGQLLDRNYRRVARQIGFRIDKKRGDDLRHFPIERARVEIIWPMLVVGLLCVIGYGWALEYNAHLAAPLILSFVIGLCVNGAFNILSTLLVDLYPSSPATATAANNLVRCLVGAGGTGIIDIMVRGMGWGWCFTFLGLVCFAAMPLLWAELKWGPGWREERAVRMDMKNEERERKWEEKERQKNAEASKEALGAETGEGDSEMK